MKRNKKGISLITLVITIIIMIILAAAIVLTLTQSGVFDKANEATGKYNLQQVQAIADLAWSEAYADNVRDVSKLQKAVDDALVANKLNDKYEAIADEKGVTVKEKGQGGGSGEGTGSGSLGTATVGTKVGKNSTINGEAYGANNPIIPKGFMPINTETSKWDEGNLADNVKNGLVISDEAGNEFVWIPVEYITEMAKVTSGVDAHGRTNYEGKLYDYHHYDEENDDLDVYDVAQEKSNYGQSTESYREPANLTYYDEVWGEDYKDKADRFTTITWTENFYQESFNKMVESVAKYKGFYVGRYEMSLDARGKAQSKAGATSLYNDVDENNWWGLYEKALTYSNSGVVSEMIWGCQYDAMMRWMKENNIDVASNEPTDTARKKAASYNTTRVTGSSDSNDILNNVYDLLGNSREWTQEANNTDNRVLRGTDYSYSNYLAFPSFRCTARSGPMYTDSSFGSRFTIYVE